MHIGGRDGKNKAKVLRMCLFEYDQEKHLRDTYEEGVEDGEKIGEKRYIWNCRLTGKKTSKNIKKYLTKHSSKIILSVVSKN